MGLHAAQVFPVPKDELVTILLLLPTKCWDYKDALPSNNAPQTVVHCPLLTMCPKLQSTQNHPGCFQNHRLQSFLLNRLLLKPLSLNNISKVSADHKYP